MPIEWAFVIHFFHNLKEVISFSIRLSTLLISPLRMPNPSIIARILLISDLVVKGEWQLDLFGRLVISRLRYRCHMGFWQAFFVSLCGCGGLRRLYFLGCVLGCV